MPDMPTFQAKLGCDNCGHFDLYDIPIRNRIVDYDREDDESYSYYYRGKNGDITYLTCRACQLPCLVVFYSKEGEVVHELEASDE